MKKLSLLLLVSTSSIYPMLRTAPLNRLAAMQNVYKSPVILHDSQQRRDYNVFSDVQEQYGSYRPHMHALAGVAYAAGAIYCTKTGSDPNILATLAAARLTSAVTLTSDNSGIRAAGGLLNVGLAVPMGIGACASVGETMFGCFDFFIKGEAETLSKGVGHLGWTILEASVSVDAANNLICKKPPKRTEGKAFKPK